MIFVEKSWNNLTGMKKNLYVTSIMALIAVLTACNPAKKYEEEEKSLIADYVADNNINVSPDSHGLYYIELEPGTGDLIKTGDSVGVYYTLYLLTGEEMENNLDSPTPYRLVVGSYQIIDGWSIGLTYMRLGTKARLLMPSDLAYGSTGYGIYDNYGYYHSVLAGYTPLLFELEVVELVRARK
jgi:FKBP-type peptidyl-prolyl cis-trans isomerase